MSTQSKSPSRTLLLPVAFTVTLFLSWPGVARAQQSGVQPAEQRRFATQWNLILGAEDLLVAGYTWAAEPEPIGGLEEPAYFTRKAWGVWSPVRFAADVFILPNLSLGAALRIGHQTYTYPVVVSGGPSGGGPTETSHFEDTDSQTALHISPRLGYATWFDAGFGTWIRAGLDVGSHNGAAAPSPDGGNYPARLVSGFSLEALAVLQPFPHTVVAVGPSYRRTTVDEGPGSHLLALALNLGVEL